MLDASQPEELLEAWKSDGAAEAPDLADPALYIDRELSWLDFNDRVLQIAESAQTPPLDRAAFCAIFTSNLDEFFMVRVAGVHDQLEAGVQQRGLSGLPPGDLLDAIAHRTGGLISRLYRCFREEVTPQLAEAGIRVLTWDELDDRQRTSLGERFERHILPILTPLAAGHGRPFPYISNLSLSLAVLVRDPDTGDAGLARVKVPKELLPRFMPAGDERTLVPLEEVIARHLEPLFPQMEILAQAIFRVTRDADFTISDEANDLLAAVEDELRRRRFGEVVRLEISRAMHPALRTQLVEALGLEERDVYEVDGLLDLTDLWELVKLPGFDALRAAPWSGGTHPRLQQHGDDGITVIESMQQGDLLVHHPYDSFTTSVERFVEQAVEDPDVLAIKQSVYRTSDDSPLVAALARATERGKQAVCLVELKARFDERQNIQWAHELEEAGVHVTYGLPGLKTHAKCLLVVRREGDAVRHYVHVGTGNYHAETARLYTDFGLFTTDPEIGADVADLYNFLTGYGRPRRYRKVLVAPHHMRDGILGEIAATVDAHQRGAEARIAMKMNSLVDAPCIRALYHASRAGVPVDLNVRGICCLRPGLPGVSENIRVVSIVGRFLEHARIYSFRRGEESRVYIGSADLMPRNLDTRVELLAPVEEEVARHQVLDVLERCLADDTDAWELGASGEWIRRTPDPRNPRSVQRELMELHAASRRPR